MTEKELFDEYQNSDCSLYKDFIDFLLNKLNVLDNYNKKLLQSDIDNHNKIVLLSQKVNDLQKENAKVEEIKANADYQLEGRDLKITELNTQIEKMVNEIDKTMVLSNMHECEICDIQDIFRKYGFKRKSNDIWEIKEK